MKLKSSLFSSFLISSISASSYDSTCNDSILKLKIPYDSEFPKAELLETIAGNCTLSGESSDKHIYSYNAEAGQATLEINYLECYDDLDADIFYVDVKIGADHNGAKIAFFSQVIGTKCGMQTDYQISFEYGSKIITADEQQAINEGCELGPNGECLISSFEKLNFTMNRYTNENFTSTSDSSDELVAGDKIYIELKSESLPDKVKFSLSKCVISDKNDANFEYEIFNFANQICQNDIVDLEWSYKILEDNSTVWHLSHRLFVFSANENAEYRLTCDVKVCLKNELNSECNNFSVCMEDEEVREKYVCDGLTCANEGNCGLVESQPSCSCDVGFAVGADSGVCEQILCDDGFHLVGSECVENHCTCSGNGNDAKGVDCPTNGIAYCGECFDGYHNEDGVCSIDVCSCPNGTPKTGQSCMYGHGSGNNGDGDCASCHAGYYKWQQCGGDWCMDRCSLKECRCSNGEASSAAECPGPNEWHCKSCNSGYQMVMRDRQQYNLRQGVHYTCNSGWAMTKLCGSGEHSDCGTDTWFSFECRNVAPSGSLPDPSTCTKLRGWFGSKLECPAGYLATGGCGSGMHADCDGEVNELTCCQHQAVTNNCQYWITSPRNSYGSNQGVMLECPMGYVMTGFCGSGRDADCQFGSSKLHNGIKCCELKTTDNAGSCYPH